MKLSRSSRRMFLRGAGLTLAVPWLSSLLPRGAQAGVAAAPVRYIQLLNPYGPSIPLFFGDRTPNVRPEPNVNLQALDEIGGDISPILGAAFDPFRAKMSVLRGLDVLIENPNHHYVFATCASGYASGVDNDEAAPLSGQESVDMVIARSNKVYGDDVPEVRRVVNMNPVSGDDYSNNRSFSWRGDGDPQMVRPVKQTQGILDPFAAGFAAAQGDGPDPRDQKLVDGVYEDYRRVRDGGRISADDKQRLNAYMDLVRDVIDGSISAICEAPTLDDESDVERTIDNQFRILAAAMACDLTRVASITMGMSQGYGTRHTEHHELYGATNSGIIDDFKRIGGRVARLLGVLDAITEGEGTVLDNAIVYWCMQYGCVHIDGQHNNDNMPVLVAGGGGGRLQQGNYIDYRLEGDGRGLPLSNLLVTFMNCMGLSSGDYESSPGGGYGYYNGDFDQRPSPEFWSSTEGRRSPLPVLYQGPAMG